MLSQAASAVADHAHSRVAVTEMLPLPPAAGTEAAPVFNVIPQRSACAGDVMVVLDEPQAVAAIVATRRAARRRVGIDLISGPAVSGAKA